MSNTEPPFHADHVGSLLRPPELLAARAERAAGRIDAAALRAVEDTAVQEAIALQESVGLKVATDGELRRTAWHMDFIYALDGVTQSADDKISVHFENDDGDINFTSAALRVDGKVGVSETIFGADFSFVQSSVSSAVPKLTIPSPSMVHYRGGNAAIDPSIYPHIEEFWSDLSAAYAEEVRRLGELGCTYLQLDDTSLAYLNDPNQRELIAELGGDREHQHLRYIRQINEALAGRPTSMRVSVHLCRGNYRSSWAADGSYDYVAEPLFGDLDVDGFFLEYDDERSGGFEPLRFVPAGKSVVLGLVSSKRGALESKDLLKRRIDEATKFVPLERLCLSPQCGFSSTVEGNALTFDDERKKLELVVQTAAEVWGE